MEHAKTREIAGQPIGQYLLAETSTALAAARALTYSAAQQLDGPQPPSPLPLYMAKLHATEMAIEVTHKALQVHGGLVIAVSCRWSVTIAMREVLLYTLHPQRC